MSLLTRIVENKKKEVARRKKSVPQDELSQQKAFTAPSRDFRKALTKPGLSLIAEIKKASPSRGAINEDLDPGIMADAYESAGADAVSVLTDRDYFCGGLDDLVTARAATCLPILRKDFLIDEYQVFESKAYGADAVLLIARLHSEKTLAGFLMLCRKLGLAALVETHTEEDVAKSISAGADIIGINNRDLRTFEVDVAITERLLPGVREGILTVSESGIVGHEEARRAANAGADALLVGESLVVADNLENKVRELKRAGRDG